MFGGEGGKGNGVKAIEVGSSQTGHSQTLLGRNTQSEEFRGAEDLQDPGRKKVAAGHQQDDNLLAALDLVLLGLIAPQVRT